MEGREGFMKEGGWLKERREDVEEEKKGGKGINPTLFNQSSTQAQLLKILEKNIIFHCCKRVKNNVSLYMYICIPRLQSTHFLLPTWLAFSFYF